MTGKEEIARQMLREHGELAVIEAGLAADAALEAGDLDTQAHWMAVRRAILGLQGPDQGKARH